MTPLQAVKNTPQPPDSGFSHPVVKVVGLCAAEVAGMLGVFAFPALLPHFMQIWDLAGCVIGIISNLGFAYLSGGFWSALLFRALCGISLAGTFIPGLKALMDRLSLSAQPRSIAFYTACFGPGLAGGIHGLQPVCASRIGTPADPHHGHGSGRHRRHAGQHCRG